MNVRIKRRSETNYKDSIKHDMMKKDSHTQQVLVGRKGKPAWHGEARPSARDHPSRIGVLRVDRHI